MSAKLESHGHGRLSRSRRHYGAMADINLTNLVDVILVLLIIFMISAPLLQSGIDVNLPQSAAAALDTKEEGIVVTIDAKGGVFIDDTWTRKSEFEKKLQAAMKKASSQSVFLRADSLTPYGSVVDIISRMRAAGINDLGLLTRPIERTQKRAK